MHKISVRTNKQVEFTDITSLIEKFIRENKVNERYIYIHVPHTTAAITINENADPDVMEDIIKALSVFDRKDYQHGEGNCQAHVKSSLIGCNLSLKIPGGVCRSGYRLKVKIY